MEFQKTVFRCFILLAFLGDKLVSSLCSPRATDNETNQKKSTRDVLKSLHKIIGFFEREYASVNLDAVFGLRIAEGILEKISIDSQRGQSLLHENTRQEVLSMHRAVSRVASKSLPYLQAATPRRYHQVGFVVSQPWRVIKSAKKLNQSLASRLMIRQRTNGSTQNGDTYDSCVARLLGSLGPEARPCDVSNTCWNMMVMRGDIGYGLTHKALYFMFGEQRGCREEFSRHLKRHDPNPPHSLDGVYERICSNMFPQMILVHEIKNKRRVDRDLFMEQSVVCGLLGYNEFLSAKRLQDVIRWQLQSGCYGNEVPHEGLDSKRDSAGAVTMRQLLVAKQLSGGCESHITGVATALLGVYLHWLTTPPPQTQHTAGCQEPSPMDVSVTSEIVRVGA